MRSLSINALITFLSAILVLMSLPTHAAQATYGLKQHIISDNETRVTIYNAKTGRTVWTKKLTRVYSELISWTPDHRAVAFVEEHDAEANNGNTWRIFIWKAETGNKVRTISHIRESSRYDLLGVDAFSQVALSPDKKRLLIRASFSQGPGTIDAGALWCLTLHSFRVEWLASSVQGPAHWINSHMVRFDHFKITETPNKTDATIMDMHEAKLPSIVRVQ